MEGLTVAYMFERAQGESSPWYAFLQTIEKADPKVLPRFWDSEVQDLLKGTEVEALGGLDVEEVKERYEQTIEPFLRQHSRFFESMPEYLTYEGFVKSLVEVCGRAFEVDNFRGLSLVPGACLFNHSDQEHVHFESQGQVCDVCGALDYCDHLAALEIEAARGMQLDSDGSDDGFEDIDNEEGELQELDEDAMDEDDEGDNEEEEDDDDDDEESDTCVIMSVRPIRAGEEIFNTYGDHGNGVLLSRYGFAIPNNLHEAINVHAEVMRFVKHENLQMRVKWWTKHAYRAIYGFHPEEYDPEEMPEDADPEAFDWRETLYIRSDGSPSDGLRILCSILSMATPKFTALRSQTERGKYAGLPVNMTRSKALKWVITKRLARYSDGGLTAKDYFKLITDTSGHKQTAMIVVATEKSVLERALKAAK